MTVFQLGIFLRVLRPARTVLRPARLCSYLPEFKKKKMYYLFTKCNCCFCVFRQGCKNACKMLADLCPCFHRSPTKLCPDLVSFISWIATEFWSFAPDCARLSVVRALNYAQILVVRVLDFAQFLLHHALFPT